jgi:hypothetical protein
MDLAEFAGFDIKCPDPTYLKYDYEVMKCPKEGVINDDGEIEHFGHIARSADYPEEGVLPLGEKLT